MARWLDVFHLMDRLFVKLFPGAQPSEGNLDVILRLESAQLDHLPGQIDDFHGVAHIEDKDFPALGLQRALQDEPDRLRDTHEITGHLRMGHGDGSTRGDLPSEGRHDTSRRAKHIAKADGGKSTFLSSSGLLLKQHFRQPLARTHNIRRVYRFVGGNQNEFGGSVLRGQSRHDFRADGIVAQGLGRLAFHQGHMLVSRGVKNKGGSMMGKSSSDGLLIANAGSTSNQLDVAMRTNQLLLDGKEGWLVSFHQNQLGRILFGNLPAQLTANASARAGDHDHPSLDQRFDSFMIESHRFTPQQIFRIHPPQMAYRDLPVQQLRDGGKDIMVDAQDVDLLDQALDHCRFGRGHSDDDFLQFQFLHK